MCTDSDTFLFLLIDNVSTDDRESLIVLKVKLHIHFPEEATFLIDKTVLLLLLGKPTNFAYRDSGLRIL